MYETDLQTLYVIVFIITFITGLIGSLIMVLLLKLIIKLKPQKKVIPEPTITQYYKHAYELDKIINENKI